MKLSAMIKNEFTEKRRKLFMPEKRYCNIMNAVAFLFVTTYIVLFAKDSLGNAGVLAILAVIGAIDCFGLGSSIEMVQNEPGDNSNRDMLYTTAGFIPCVILAYLYWRIAGHNLGMLALGVAIGFVSWLLWRPKK